MPNLSYRVSIESPCPGEQIVLKVAGTHFTGANGDFTYMVLNRHPAESQWTFTVYDYSGGPCTPSKLFKQVTPDADNPNGEYAGPSPADRAVVSDFP